MSFEPVLLRLRDSAQENDKADSLQRQLLFEFRAMLTELDRDASKQV